MAMITPKLLNRFWSKVEVCGPDACWPWRASFYPRGYGQFVWHGEERGAHRVAYRLSKGAIPNGLVVMHTCDNRWCVNPNHLVAGTQKQNIDDAREKGRAPQLCRGSAGPYPVSKAEETDILRRFHGGEPIKSIVRNTGRARGTVRRIVRSQ